MIFLSRFLFLITPLSYFSFNALVIIFPVLPSIQIIFDNEGADWTFVCPPDYKNITNKEKRITEFFNDGVDAITEFLKQIGYDVPINIPKRYRY